MDPNPVPLAGTGKHNHTAVPLNTSLTATSCSKAKETAQHLMHLPHSPLVLLGLLGPLGDPGLFLWGGDVSSSDLCRFFLGGERSGVAWRLWLEDDFSRKPVFETDCPPGKDPSATLLPFLPDTE